MAEGWLTAYLEVGWAKAGSRAFTQLVGEGQGTTDFLMCSQHVSSPAPFCLGPGLKRHLLYFYQSHVVSDQVEPVRWLILLVWWLGNRWKGRQMAASHHPNFQFVN